jgi:hypothetical protein
VNGIEGEIEEERLCGTALPVNEGGGLLAKSVGEITALVHGVPVAQDGRVVFALTGGLDDVLMTSTEKTEKLIEPAIHGHESRSRSEVPFAHHERRVAGGLEALRQCNGLCWQRAGEVLDAVAVFVSAAYQRRARRRAERAVGVGVGESDAGFRDAVNVRRRDVLATVRADVGVTHIIGENDDNVRLGLQHGQRD